MIEVEIKVKIDNADDMRKKFMERNGIYKMSLLHEDTYFNMPEGLRDFRKSDEALRIRKSIESHLDRKEPRQKPKYFITYKGKKLDSTTKTRKELESIVEEGEKLKEMLKLLGFRETFTVKKERELYKFEHYGHKIEALIDYLPILKEHFIEVEIGTDSEEEVDKATQILFDFLNTLGVKEEESIRKSYLELIADKFKGKRRD